jgi:hypothetical protein
MLAGIWLSHVKKAESPQKEGFQFRYRFQTILSRYTKLSRNNKVWKANGANSASSTLSLVRSPANYS